MPILLAKDIMSTPVITIQDNEIISNFITTLLDNGISGVPVTDKQGELKGIITKTDLITFELERVLTNLYTDKLNDIINEVNEHSPLISNQKEKEHHRTLLVKDMMIHNVLTVPDDTPIKDICIMMKKEKIRHVVVTQNRKMTGIVTATDIIKLISDTKTDLCKEDYQ